MAISKVIIKNFKKFQGIFEIELKKGMNILVGDNGAGKSTILEAIHIALTGEYAGRSIRNQLSTYLFNKKVVDEYLKSVADGKPTEPPSILVELYFEKGTQPEYEGNGNSECKDGLEGIMCSIAFSEEYKKEYEAMVKLKTLKSLPIEFYEIKWTTFARENKIPKYISEKSVLIDSSNYRYQNGSDVYISRIIKDILEPEDITAITQAYRNMVDEFADNNAIAVINNKISEASTIMNGNISLSADHGNKDSWEASLVTQIDGIPFANVGKGAQCIVKTQLALNHRKAENAGVILLEEPESHLSFSRLSMLMDSMNTVTNEKQIIISTHSSFVANKLGLENLIFLANNNCLSMKNLSEDTFKFFKKLAGYDTLRLILCKKAILVEGDSDELIVQRAYMDNHNGKLPIHDGIDVITMRGLTFKRFLEISKSLKKVTAVVSDNDGDFDAVVNKYREYENETYIKICIDNEIDTGGLENFNYNTLEPKLLKENNVELFNEIFKTSYDSDEEMLNYMHSRKSECALAIFESDHSIKYPEYILKAVRDE